MLSRAAGFWLLACLLGALLAAASAPSPLYGIYQARFGFSPLTLTAIYAVYAFAALGALLVTGRLSDHIGRRPVTAAGLAVQVGGMMAFVAAAGVEGLYLARVLQGIGTGMATGAISAWLIDLQPPANPRFASLVSGIALIAGLAAGALGSALLAEYGPDPVGLIFWLLTAVYAVGLGGIALTPDLGPRSAGWRRAIRPQVAVPPSARGVFVAVVPSLVAVWAVAGLYLSLGPGLALTLAGSANRVVGGSVIVALLGTGAVASYLARRADGHQAVIRGSAVVFAGIALTLIAVVLGSAALLFAGSVLAGVGFGPAFSGVFRIVTPLAPPERRGALLAAFYVVVYLAFSVPTVVAGAAVTRVGLTATTLAYGAVAMVLTAITAMALVRHQRPATARTAPG